MIRRPVKLKTAEQLKAEQQRWQNMLRYYKWFFLFFFLAFAVVLLYERLIPAGICMLVFAWYVAPVAAVRKFDEKLGIGKKLIFFAAVAGLLLSVILMLRQGA